MVGSIPEKLIIKKPEIVSSHGGESFISLLLNEDFANASKKVKLSEAKKMVCVKACGGGENLLVLPLHIACTIPKVPHALMKSLIEAYPEALMCHTTLKQKFRMESSSSKKKMNSSSSSLEVDLSVSSSSSSIPIAELSASMGVGWLPIHAAALYGVSVDTLELLLIHESGSVYCKTTQGLLPLHIACRAIETSQHLIQTLVTSFPQSVNVPTSCGISAAEIVELDSEDTFSDISQLLVVRSGREETSTSSDQTTTIQLPRPLHSILNPKRVSSMKKIFSSSRRSMLEDTMHKEQELFKTLSGMEWDEALNSLSRKPKYANIWTLSQDSRDPPCHLLSLHLGLRRNAPMHVIEAILDANPGAIHKREYKGMLPLHLACHLGMDTKVINLLCKAYPEAAKRADFSGLLPIHIACKIKNPSIEVVTYLLKLNPSSLHEKDNDGLLPQEYLADNNPLLKEFKRGENFWAARTISETKLSLLIWQKKWDAALSRAKAVPEEAGVWTIHQVMHLHYLPLHYACILKAPIDLVNALLEAHPEAALAQCQEYDMLPLHLALQHGSGLDIVEALLQSNKKSVTVTDSFDLLPLHLACTKGANISVITALVKANPKACEAMDHNGHTPKTYASNTMLPNSKMVVKLLETPEFAC